MKCLPLEHHGNSSAHQLPLAIFRRLLNGKAETWRLHDCTCILTSGPLQGVEEHHLITTQLDQCPHNLEAPPNLQEH